MSTGLRAGTNNDGYLQVNGTDVLTALSSGSVGIGTNNPLVKLHVASSGAEQVRLSKNGAEGLEVFLGNNTDVNLFQHFNRTSNTWVENRQNALRHTFANSGNGNEVFRIDSTGNVGIGTDNPRTKLEIAGNTTNVNGYSDGQVQIVGNNPIAFVSQSNLNPALNRWGFQVRAAGVDGNFSIYDFTNSRHSLLINSSGKIGIDQTSPQNVLDLGSGTGNRGISWGGTNFNYVNIWTEYGTGDLHIGTGIRPEGTNTGWVSSYGGASTGRTLIKSDYSAGDISFHTAPASTVANGSAVTVPERFRIYSDGSQFASQRYSGANDSYVRRSWRHFQSSFNNPTVDLCTISIGTQNNAVVIYVRVIHIEYYGTATNTGIISEGMASIRRESTVYTPYAGNMSIIKSATSSNVGTLSWNNQTLQYTPNRVANYDAYYVEFEAFGSLGASMTITPSW